jgi:hypothetical protein
MTKTKREKTKIAPRLNNKNDSWMELLRRLQAAITVARTCAYTSDGVCHCEAHLRAAINSVAKCLHDSSGEQKP